MDFGSSVVYAAKESTVEYEEVPESKYNHVVKGYASGGATDYHDDGEVRQFNMQHALLILMTIYFCRHVCLIFWTQQDRRSSLQ